MKSPVWLTDQFLCDSVHQIWKRADETMHFSWPVLKTVPVCRPSLTAFLWTWLGILRWNRAFHSNPSPTLYTGERDKKMKKGEHQNWPIYCLNERSKRCFKWFQRLSSLIKYIQYNILLIIRNIIFNTLSILILNLRWLTSKNKILGSFYRMFQYEKCIHNVPIGLCWTVIKGQIQM